MMLLAELPGTGSKAFYTRALGPMLGSFFFALDLQNNHLMRRHAIHARGTPGKSKVLAHHTAPESPGSETMFEGSLILS